MAHETRNYKTISGPNIYHIPYHENTNINLLWYYGPTCSFRGRCQVIRLTFIGCGIWVFLICLAKLFFYHFWLSSCGQRYTCPCRGILNAPLKHGRKWPKLPNDLQTCSRITTKMIRKLNPRRSLLWYNPGNNCYRRHTAIRVVSKTEIFYCFAPSR